MISVRVSCRRSFRDPQTRDKSSSRAADPRGLTAREEEVIMHLISLPAENVVNYLTYGIETKGPRVERTTSYEPVRNAVHNEVSIATTSTPLRLCEARGSRTRT